MSSRVTLFKDLLYELFTSSRNKGAQTRQKRSPSANGRSGGPPTPEPPAEAVAANGKPLYLCSPFVDAALVKGNFKTIVMLPKYCDIMEWVAVNSYVPTPSPC